MACVGARSIGSTRPEVILNHMTVGNWNTYALYFYNSQESSGEQSNLRKTTQEILSQDNFLEVFYGEVDCKYDGCAEILSVMNLDSAADTSLDQYALQDEDMPFLAVFSHGAGYIMKGENLGPKIEKAIHGMQIMANVKDVDDFQKRIDFSNEPLRLKHN